MIPVMADYANGAACQCAQKSSLPLCTSLLDQMIGTVELKGLPLRYFHELCSLVNDTWAGSNLAITATRNEVFTTRSSRPYKTVETRRVANELVC